MDSRVEFLKEKIAVTQDIIKAGLDKKKINGVDENILVELIQINGYLTLLAKKGNNGENISDEEFKTAQKINERLNEILNNIK